MYDGIKHEGNGKGWACNNHNMRKPIIKDVGRGYACYDCLIPICFHAAPEEEVEEED